MQAIHYVHLLLVFSYVVSAQGQNCEEITQKSDNCLKHLMLIGQENVTVPRTIADLDGLFCSTVRRDLKCAGGIKQCLAPFLKTIFNVMARGIRTGIKEICGSTQIKERTLAHLECFEDKDFQILYKIVDRCSVALDIVQKKVETDKLLPNICCMLHQFIDTARKEVDQRCAKLSGDATSNFVFGMINSLMGDAVDLGCSRYDSLETCQRRLPESIKIFESTNETTGNSFTPVIPLLKILERLDS